MTIGGGTRCQSQFHRDPEVCNPYRKNGGVLYGEDNMQPDSFGLNDDFAAQIERAGQLASENCEDLCLQALLSMPISYTYAAHASRKQGELFSSFFGRIFFAYGSPTYGRTISDATYLGCSGYGLAYVTQGGMIDDFTMSSWGTWLDDDGISEVPTNVARLKEGVERFYITDISNPAAGAQAQSTIPVMWDNWGDNSNVSGETQAHLTFNHIPGGGNVLYMDGHVRFVRLNEGFPIAYDMQAPRLASQWSVWSNFWAGAE